jgi:glycosyltransferase involved in cell wall biosynthesis/peptidoglycan/xylan/chitin deacetylase (PgdA/CDA1 family)
MIRTALYYSVKPLLPVSVRRTIRRQFALRKRRRVANVWPVLPGSERPPEGWPGWPGGKRFALVLTHDVEGQSGVDQCRQLMELERKHGFHSSFNFIPEGEYRVEPGLRKELETQGFEVGVHDLHHDGRLYSNRRKFAEKAVRINHYLQSWGAVGFRSGFMLHNLEWLGDLDALYDASTFDTDPFEPQPDNVGTIFPFWVPRAGKQGDRSSPSPGSKASNGYVELPYTLPQDSTLFLILGERKPDIWLQKLDWIAQHGGMALLNVHPDYLGFAGEKPSLRTFPAAIYADFLKYARQQYGDSFWHPLPRELAAYAARLKPSRPPKPRHVCMVTYSHFLSDTRVMRYAEALSERGDQVDVISLQGAGETLERETIGHIHIRRIQERVGRRGKSRLSYLLPVLRFFFAASLRIARQHARQRYDLLHIHNLPDFLVFAACYPRLNGARTILDIHDVLPEFYSSKFGVREDCLGIRMLKWVERMAAACADHVIISNHLWLDKYTARTGAGGKCSVFVNNVDTKIFHPRTRTRRDGKFILIFPGGLYWHQGLDIAIRAFQQVAAAVPQAEFHIYGDGNMKESLVALARELQLDGKILFFDWIPVRDMAGIMANADLGVVPKRADSFGNEAYSTKIMEFMSLGVPVVISSTKIDRYYFDDSVVRFFESGNSDALAEALLDMYRDENLRRSMAERASVYATRNSWESRKRDYLHLVDSLIRVGKVEPKDPPATPEMKPTAAPRSAGRASEAVTAK